MLISSHCIFQQGFLEENFTRKRMKPLLERQSLCKRSYERLKFPNFVGPVLSTRPTARWTAERVKYNRAFWICCQLHSSSRKIVANSVTVPSEKVISLFPRICSSPEPGATGAERESKIKTRVMLPGMCFRRGLFWERDRPPKGKSEDEIQMSRPDLFY